MSIEYVVYFSYTCEIGLNSLLLENIFDGRWRELGGVLENLCCVKCKTLGDIDFSFKTL